MINRITGSKKTVQEVEEKSSSKVVKKVLKRNAMNIAKRGKDKIRRKKADTTQKTVQKLLTRAEQDVGNKVNTREDPRITKKNEVIAKLKDNFKKNMTIKEACLYAGINETTYWRRKNKNTSFAMEMLYYENYFRNKSNEAMSAKLEAGAIDPFKALTMFDERYSEKKKKEKNLVQVVVVQPNEREQAILDGIPSVNLGITIPEEIKRKLPPELLQMVEEDDGD